MCISTVRPDTLEHAITSVRCQTWNAWELIVAGQGDEAALREAVKRAAGDDERIRYVHLPERGLSRARNAAARVARGDIVAFTDDDCEAQSDWLATIAQTFDAHPDVGLVGGSLSAPAPRWRTLSTCLSVYPAEVLYDPRPAQGLAPPGFEWYGANVAIRRSVLERTGPFDPLLGAGARFRSSEDVDYKMRLEAAGVPMLTTPRSVVFHTYGRRSGVRAVTRYWRDQDVGSGALAGKLTLMGDPRGRAWLREALREQTIGWLRRPRPHQIVSYPIRLSAFLRTYRLVVAGYRVDGQGLLAPRI